MNGSKCDWNIFSKSIRERINFVNLRAKGLRILNIINIFVQKSWNLNGKTLTQVFKALVGSIFDHSYFEFGNCRKTNSQSVQRAQNIAEGEFFFYHGIVLQIKFL